MKPPTPARRISRLTPALPMGCVRHRSLPWCRLTGEGTPDVQSKARIEIQNGGFEGMVFELSSAETLIGRNPTTDITLLDDGISREHAVILLDEDSGDYVVEDLQSTNGTKVNGKRVRSTALQSGDLIELGRTRFQFHREG